MGALALLMLGGSGLARADEIQPDAVTPPVQQAAPTPDSGMGSALFYQLLLGELQVRESQPGAGYTLMLDAARRTKRSELFRRAVEIALQGRSGESALQAARAWTDAQPRSVEAQRFVLEILLGLDRPAEIAAPLRSLLRLTPGAQRREMILALPPMLDRLGDKAATLKVVTPVLQEAGRNPAVASAASVSLGRLQLGAAQPALALETARKALEQDPKSALPAWLALMLFEQRVTGAEALLQRWLETPGTEDSRLVRLEYARLLADRRRDAQAWAQVVHLTRAYPDMAEPWLLEGLLLLRLQRLDQAAAALERYLALQPKVTDTSDLIQARLLLSQVAEGQGRLDAALSWLDGIKEAEAQSTVQPRRALLLARMGKLTEARALLRSQPIESPADERRQLQAEAQLLRELGRYGEALEVYAQATARFPQDADLAYERAMVAERAGRHDEMKRLLRELIARVPDHAHACNALGYAMADRNENLTEARELIRRALELRPDDPFIQDSLGWVEFRLGHLDEARRVLQAAYDRQPDAEIAAHLGEVLWSSDQREAALAVWRAGLRQQADNEVLQRTLQRLNVQP